MHCAATDIGLEIILERAELTTGEGSGGDGGGDGGGDASFRVTLDASSCSLGIGTHSPIALTCVGVTTGGCTVVDVSAKLHVIIPVTRVNLLSLLTQPLRVDMRQLALGRGGGGGGEGVEDTIVGLVPLGDMLRDEYPEAFGRECFGPVKVRRCKLHR